MLDDNNEKTTNSNLSDISKPLCLLIDKTSRGVEWLANALAPESAGVNAYIESIKNGNYPEEIKAVLIANARKTIREARNQANILRMASKLVNPDTDISHVSLSWMDEFMDHAKNVSDEELQILWARILKSEIEHSGESVCVCLMYYMA